MGVSELIIFLIYFVLMLFYLISFYSIIVKTEYVLLMIALAFFCVSIICDLFHFWILYEDGAKMVGIVYFLFYFSLTGASSINSYTQEQESEN